MKKWYYPEFKCEIKCFITAFKEKFENNYCFSGEMHNFWELVYVTEGSLFVSEDSKIYELSQGELIFHKPMEFHRIWVEKEQSAKAIIMSFELENDIFSELSHGVYKLNVEEKNALEEVYQLIDKNFNHDHYVERIETPNILAEKLAFMHFEIFLISLLSSQGTNRGRQYNTSAMNYKTIIDTMNDNLYKKLSMTELAALCNQSVPNLKKIFAKYTDDGVMKHFNRLKIKKAMQLLKRGIPLAEISYQLGFSSQGYFSIVFHRETGMLPSEFKNASNMEVKISDNT